MTFLTLITLYTIRITCLITITLYTIKITPPLYYYYIKHHQKYLPYYNYMTNHHFPYNNYIICNYIPSELPPLLQLRYIPSVLPFFFTVTLYTIKKPLLSTERNMMSLTPLRQGLYVLHGDGDLVVLPFLVLGGGIGHRGLVPHDLDCWHFHDCHKLEINHQTQDFTSITYGTHLF